MSAKLAIACAAAMLWAIAAGAQTPPIFGEMKPGPHSVGFRIIELRDETRPVRPKKDYYGNAISGDRARMVSVHVWYPAVADGVARMTVGDVMDVHGAEEGRTRRTNLRGFVERSFGKVADEAWQKLLAMPLLAGREAPPAAGRFPLVVGQLRPFSTELTNEYLASHGYVVAMTQGPQAPQGLAAGPGLELAVRDMELAVVRLRGERFVDGGRLAVLGFSGSGFSQILLAMRHPDVDAAVDLESAIFDDRVGWPLMRGFGYDVNAMRAAFLHTYGVPLAKLENSFGEFEKMKYSHRFHYLVDAPQIHHWDFATEGMAASTVLGLRPENAARLRKAFEMTNLYVLNFFNAFVKGDAAGLAFLRRDPVANGAPPQAVTVRELAAVRAAPTVADMNAILEKQGIAEGMRIFRQARQEDAGAPVFAEARVNQIAYGLLNQQKVREAIEFFKWNAETYPASANAHDSLAEAYERAGETELAHTSTHAALAAADAQPGLQDAQRARLKELQQQRLARLGKK